MLVTWSELPRLQSRAELVYSANNKMAFGVQLRPNTLDALEPDGLAMPLSLGFAVAPGAIRRPGFCKWHYQFRPAHRDDIVAAEPLLKKIFGSDPCTQCRGSRVGLDLPCTPTERDGHVNPSCTPVW